MENQSLHEQPEDQRSCKRSSEICYINQIFILRKFALYEAPPTNQNKGLGQQSTKL